MSLSEREEERALERRIDLQGWLLAAGFLCAYALVNASTLLLDPDRRGTSLPPAQPLVEELSSAALLIALFPLVAACVRRAPTALASLLRAVPPHSLATIACPARHVS